WFGQGRRSTGRPANFEYARAFFRSYQRARGVVHGNEIGLWIYMIKSGTHGIAPFCSARGDFFHLCRLANNLSKFAQTISAADQNNFVDAISVLERSDRVGDHRLSAYQREQFVEAHSFAAPGGDDVSG